MPDNYLNRASTETWPRSNSSETMVNTEAVRPRTAARAEFWGPFRLIAERGFSHIARAVIRISVIDFTAMPRHLNYFWARSLYLAHTINIDCPKLADIAFYG
jgi:hypothetical protein